MSRFDDIVSMKVDRSQIAVFESFEDSKRSEREYWKTCTPEERLTALEMLRRVAYGYDEDQQGLRGFFEVTSRKKS